MTPQVILLRIDHMAKRATPRIAKTDENIIENSFQPTPHAIDKRKTASIIMRILMYLNINRVRVILISARSPTLFAACLRKN